MGSKLLDQVEVMTSQADRTTQALVLVQQIVRSGAVGGFYPNALPVHYGVHSIAIVFGRVRPQPLSLVSPVYRSGRGTGGVAVAMETGEGAQHAGLGTPRPSSRIWPMSYWEAPGGDQWLAAGTQRGVAGALRSNGGAGGGGGSEPPGGDGGARPGRGELRVPPHPRPSCARPSRPTLPGHGGDTERRPRARW